ncbi:MULTISPECIES: DNA polymerase III subunit gamma/tau [Cryobacterium]|uniref:DNA polymerase III subunit gamma/tau n=1 Tax=Cryobacterium glucosi TaxID=1259175 RepID=A0ABY2ITN9_9MICO|nr:MULTISPECIES: DNA polymerase III subunit gamma/tau [Cryobacterium]MDY7528291.1 DNA polymerase III subunit gamma/tau [Cryobacterium sp. 10C2]MDY7555963.1 DNA polymerase III subunit gamma/tau [Cryobacterium sp. 10C3]MEB0004718.1 DNA polymerase III subunit gamma/tau [Cryobacterium sp. RTC2.1]MEB0202199.1 DNA polymerase III subunit gamma/tau [Cryobacterium sp. 5I3]MEB0286324.1 DNA polymerase III subunit gamma/tau [Cryobacterium sp. 10S3]
MTSAPRGGNPRDDDALGWAGDDDPTLQTRSEDADARENSRTPVESDPVASAPASAPVYAALPDGWSVKGPTAAIEADAAARNSERSPMSSFTLISLGVFGGIYLLFTIGWFIGVSRIDNPLGDALASFMFSLGTWLAVAAPVAWFAVTLWLTPTRPRGRILWLLLGVVLLAPLPLLVSGGAVA